MKLLFLKIYKAVEPTFDKITNHTSIERGDIMIQISDYINVKERAHELDCNMPTSLALLPRNFETAKSKDELVHENTVPTIRKLWRQNNIVETRLEKEGERIPCIHEKTSEWIVPTIFITSALLSQNPHLVSLALGVISNFLADWFRGIPGGKKVKLNIVIEPRIGGFKHIQYEGNVDGLKDLPKIIHEVNNE